MDPIQWRGSFTKKWFFCDEETLPEDAVQQITKQVQDLYQDAATWIRRLHADRWHTLCSYPLQPDARGTCIACKTIVAMEQLLFQVSAHASEVVLDFFHEPDHKDQLEEAMELYAWTNFHQSKHGGELVRWQNELLDFSRNQVRRLYRESYAHKEMCTKKDNPGETSQEDLKPLVLTFAKTYDGLVREFAQWREENPGVIISAFPL